MQQDPDQLLMQKDLSVLRAAARMRLPSCQNHPLHPIHLFFLPRPFYEARLSTLALPDTVANRGPAAFHNTRRSLQKFSNSACYPWGSLVRRGSSFDETGRRGEFFRDLAVPTKNYEEDLDVLPNREVRRGENRGSATACTTISCCAQTTAKSSATVGNSYEPSSTTPISSSRDQEIRK